MIVQTDTACFRAGAPSRFVDAEIEFDGCAVSAHVWNDGFCVYRTNVDYDVAKEIVASQWRELEAADRKRLIDTARPWLA